MDWSLIALLFATGFALVGLTFLIIVVYKVFLKPPSANNFPNAPPPPPQPQQPPPVNQYMQQPSQPPQNYNWSLHSGQAQKLGFGTGSGYGSESGIQDRGLPPSSFSGQERGLMPIGMTMIPTERPVFSPEPPVHRAVRVTPVSPVPHSVATPVTNTVWNASHSSSQVIPADQVQVIIVPEVVEEANRGQTQKTSEFILDLKPTSEPDSEPNPVQEPISKPVPETVPKSAPEFIQEQGPATEIEQETVPPPKQPLVQERQPESTTESKIEPTQIPISTSVPVTETASPPPKPRSMQISQSEIAAELVFKPEPVVKAEPQDVIMQEQKREPSPKQEPKPEQGPEPTPQSGAKQDVRATSDPIPVPESVPETVSNPEPSPEPVPKPCVEESPPEQTPSDAPPKSTVLPPNEGPNDTPTDTPSGNPDNAPTNPPISSNQRNRSRRKPKGKDSEKKKRLERTKRKRKDTIQEPSETTNTQPNVHPSPPECEISESDDADSGESSEKTPEEHDANESVKSRKSSFLGKFPKSVLPALCAVSIMICVLSAALFIHFTGLFDEPQDEPLIVEIPQESMEGAEGSEGTGGTPENVPPEPEPAIPVSPVSYKMALIGEQEAVSSNSAGFEESFPAGDYTDSTFYALSFVIQLDSGLGTEFQEIKVFDAATSEDLTATSSSILHVYPGELPSAEYVASHPVKSAPVISAAVSDEVITCVFISLEKKGINDLKVMLLRADNALNGGEEVTVNSQIEEIGVNPVYTMGNSLLKLGEQYYIAEPETGIGAVPNENKYVTRKIRCVSLPLTGAAPGLNASSVALYDKTTGVKAVLPEGTEVYYKEVPGENQGLMSVEFGVKMSGGSYEEAALFMDAVIPGYDLDGQPLMT